VAASCASHEGAGAVDQRPGITEAASSQPAGTFGTLAQPVCGPGDATGATAPGVSAGAIKVGVMGDAANTLIPDLNKELIDASQAFVAWCNKAGGIRGRKLDLTVHDAGLLRAREVMTEACTQEFAVVGGGLALDFQSVGVRTACGLTEFPGFANSPDERESDHQVQAIPAYKTHWPATQYVQIAKAMPGAVGSFGLLTTSAQLGSGRPYVQRLMDAIGPLGYKLAYTDNLPAPPVPVDNWRPYVEDMRAKGVKVLDFQVTPEYLIPLLKTMRDVGWFPDAIVLPPNFYNPALLDAGDALRNIYINAYIHPFEDAARNPPTRQFLDIMDTDAPGWKRAALAVNSFSAWLLFAQAAGACGSQLTRDCVERQGLAVGTWDGGGLHAPNPVDTKAEGRPVGCGLLLTATSSGFAVDDAKTAANRGIYNCSTENLPNAPL
jgi:ABC-type branched-subunit amino acid transport system substrate-binding protein